MPSIKVEISRADYEKLEQYAKDGDISEGTALALIVREFFQKAKRTKRKEDRESRATRLPNDFELPEEWVTWVEENYPGWDYQAVSLTFMRFKNYWVAKPNNATKCDWFATWKNWVISTADDIGRAQENSKVRWSTRTSVVRDDGF